MFMQQGRLLIYLIDYTHLESVRRIKKDLCLYYHIGQCLGYCTNNVAQEKIEEMEKEIVSF